jgi:hypothetical protein
MSQQRDIIRNGLQELSNASESAPDCWVTFQANGNEHWLQCTPARINMDWPFSYSPAESKRLTECFGRSVKIDAWQADTYVTFTPAVRDVEALIAGINSVFQDLYELGADYVLDYRIEGA